MKQNGCHQFHFMLAGLGNIGSLRVLRVFKGLLDTSTHTAVHYNTKIRYNNINQRFPSFNCMSSQ